MRLKLLFLFFLATLSSQSAMDLFASLLTFSIFFQIVQDYRERKQNPIRPLFFGFEIFWLIWFFVVVLSFIFSPQVHTGWVKYLLEFRWVIIMYALSWILIELNLKKEILVWVCTSLFFASLYAVIVWFLDFDPLHPDNNMAPWAGGHRTGGLLSDAMTFAHLYAAYFCLCFGLSLTALRAKASERVFLVAALLVTGVALILSFTRGVWIGVAAASLVMSFIFSFRLGFGLLAAGGTGVFFLLLLWPTFAQRLTMAFESGDERSWIWKGHWQIFKDYPMTGVGYGENSKMIAQYYLKIGAPLGVIESHAHNQYLHFLAGTGVLGCLVYLVFLAGVLWLGANLYKKIEINNWFEKGLVLGCIGAHICFCLGGLTEANFERSKVRFVMIVVWSILLWLAKKNQILPIWRRA